MLVHHLFKRTICSNIVRTPWVSMNPKSLDASIAPSTVTVKIATRVVIKIDGDGSLANAWTDKSDENIGDPKNKQRPAMPQTVKAVIAPRNNTDFKFAFTAVPFFESIKAGSLV